MTTGTTTTRTLDPERADLLAGLATARSALIGSTRGLSYEQVAARSEQVVATIPDMSATHPLPEAPWNPPGGVRSVRQVLVHVIAEPTQHAGHADILREAIDGHTSS